MGTARLIFALSVVFAHSPVPLGLSMTGGILAVQCFFVISGFYMAMVLAEKYPPTPSGRFAFWSNRLLRLAPCYLVVLLVTVLLSFNPRWLAAAPASFPPAFSAWQEYFTHMSSVTRVLLGTVNLTVVGQDFAQFLALDPSDGSLVFAPFGATGALVPVWRFIMIPQAWTLALELMFYALAPWLVRRSTPWLTAAILLSVIVRLGTYACFGRHEPWTYRFFPSELGFFLLGILAYRWHLLLRISPPHPLPVARIARVTCATVLLLLLGYEIISPLLPVVAFAAALPWLFLASSSWRADRWLGDLSYPVYLVHVCLLPIVAGLTKPLGLRFPGLLSAFFAVALAALFNRWIDRPLDAWRQHRAVAAQRP